MRRFIKFFSVILVFLFSVSFSVLFVEATWPPITSCGSFYDVCKHEDAATATYCFFNPDKVDVNSCNGASMEPPSFHADFKDIPVAICFWNKKAKDIFCEYCSKNIGDISEVISLDTYPYENVFVISYKDLIDMAYNTSISLYTQNGLMGGENDVEWSKYYVMMLSCLEAKWEVLVPNPAPCPEYRKKVRVLMHGLKSVKFGETIRVYKAGDAAEWFFVRLGFTGKKDVIGEPIFWATSPGV